ncbi:MULTISPECIES: ACP S-malonyltransferase [Leclercia]|uniref:ACP S-malonyltransferase n=1 Tax=Leclercia TaxID=83654 RepID=UPI0012E80BCD|nr:MULTISPECIES: ACP S-malonyltransferase [Leclercia]QGW16345.1 ACP S-malonyltransferase [Leclercia sp. Colony189]URM24370.1 hypothetical protein JJN11_07615 [Leclercia adecarboxylata]
MNEKYVANRNNIVGFFPGLGSRAVYQNIGGELLHSGNKRIEQIYRDAAIAMGYGDQPEKMLITPATLPEGKMERQGFIGASFLTHNLALAALCHAQAEQQNLSLHVVAYGGESFGMINAAVASGALSIGDGVKIANFFTPYILLASESHDDPFSQAVFDYYPPELKAQPLVTEFYYVIALRGREKTLADASAALKDEFLSSEIEVHKIYSRRQINLYVKASIKSCFDIFMKNFADIEVIKLKEPTAFITHSAQLAPLTWGLEQFLLDQQIVFQDPHTPVIANHCDKILTDKEEIRLSILALVDQVMVSATSASMADGLGADAIIELGLGNKSVQMLRDNPIHTPTFSFTGDRQEASLIMGALGALTTIRDSSDPIQVCIGIDRWLDVARAHTEFAAQFLPKITQAIQQVEKIKLEVKGNIPVSVASIYKNSWRYRHFLQSGERVLMARLKRNIQGDSTDKHQTYADLKILTPDGMIRYQKTPFIIHAEKTLFYLSSLDELSNTDVFNALQELATAPDYAAICLRIEAQQSEGASLRRLLQLRTVEAQPETQVIRRIILQTLTFELLNLHRPGLFHKGKSCLVSRDFIGWLACLVTAGAASLDNAVQLCRDYYSRVGRKLSPWAVVKHFAAGLTDARVPVISITGLPLTAQRDLEINTYKMLLGEFPDQQMQAALDCHLSVITLDSLLAPDALETAPYQAEIMLIASVRDVWSRNPELILEQREREAQADLTDEYHQVADYAERRNLLCGTINAYIEADEVPVLFCNSGSESMTMFIQRSPDEPIVVRKILSEALTAAKWSPGGQGVMLPPFAKAARQVDYLRALPDSVKPFFPQIYRITEREILTPVGQERVGKDTCKEVIYEMSLIEGEEVSQFIQRNCLAPPIVARLYEIIFTFLRDNVHREKRKLSGGNTLEIAYFRKIEDRLGLCRQTAPRTFGPELLDSEKIIINGGEFLNIKALLSAFRSHPEYQRMLEPRYHSLVMGDTNTENIKINNTAPLLAVQELINQQRSEEEITQALTAINANIIQLRFLDPRAIGFQSEGAGCQDDYMYDNKPWHNSIGHYDEIHNELFTLDMNVSAGESPVIRIQFTDNNVYQQSYKVADCAQNNSNPLNDPSIVGIEKYFAQVMSNVYDSANPNSIYVQDDPWWLVRLVFVMGTHFAAMPPFHFSSELDGTIKDSVVTQRRPVAIYCEGIKWLNWALEILQGKRDHFLGLSVPVVEQTVTEAL